MMRGIALGSFPASRAPFSKRDIKFLIFSSAAPTVMMPSQSRPVRSLMIGPAVATYTGGGVSGIVYNRALSSRICSPVNFTTLPVNSF